MKRPYIFALIGSNIAYSKSKEVFEAVFKIKNGVSGTFEIHSVAPSDFKTKLFDFKSDGTKGISVTIPYKSEIIQYLDDIDPVAHALQAVNCVVVEKGRLLGFNTDYYGFSLPLKQYNPKLKHGRAAIIGCGGAARAVIYSLFLDFEIRDFTVVGRSMEKLDDLKQILENRFNKINLNTTIDRGYLNPEEAYNITVNCTPLGGWNHIDENPLGENYDWKSTKIYYDLNYNSDNKIIKAARDAGVVAVDGSAMLVGQALRAFDIWTGQMVSFEPVYREVFMN
ncbi:MAG: shikimate dehydrogenase [candidate division Zixibacteria bacterium]|nr:shikimate dehydrogenase [candidate division Zixibacteria bacterium]